MTIARLIPTLLVLTTLTACGLVPPDSPGLGRTGSAIVSNEEISMISSLSRAERDGTVAFLNDAGTTRAMLDADCRLHSDAASWLIRYRDGKDRVLGTADDNLFDDMYEVADTKEVGPYNLAKAIDCARDHGFVAEEVVTLIEDYNQLSTEVQAVVEDLIDIATAATACDNGYIQEGGCNAPFYFRWAEITSFGSVVTGYLIDVGHLIDPEGGIVENATFTLDADFDILDVTWDAG
jgi:hypothetical protein